MTIPNGPMIVRSHVGWSGARYCAADRGLDIARYRVRSATSTFHTPLVADKDHGGRCGGPDIARRYTGEKDLRGDSVPQSAAFDLHDLAPTVQSDMQTSTSKTWSRRICTLLATLSQDP